MAAVLRGVAAAFSGSAVALPKLAGALPGSAAALPGPAAALPLLAVLGRGGSDPEPGQCYTPPSSDHLPVHFVNAVPNESLLDVPKVAEQVAD